MNRKKCRSYHSYLQPKLLNFLFFAAAVLCLWGWAGLKSFSSQDLNFSNTSEEPEFINHGFQPKFTMLFPPTTSPLTLSTIFPRLPCLHVPHKLCSSVIQACSWGCILAFCHHVLSETVTRKNYGGVIKHLRGWSTLNFKLSFITLPNGKSVVDDLPI